jgi:transcription termination factor Rho
VENGDDAGDESDSEDDASAEAKPRRRGRRGGRGRGGGREKLASEDRGDAPENEETEEVTGILEITRQRHGFLSVEGSDDDVYVSASQVRRCEMKEGDEVTGPMREPRRGERHRALVRVNLVNGEPPVDAPATKKKSGGGGAQPPKASAASQTVEVTLVSVEDDRVVIEVLGSEHELEPGGSVEVSLD